MSRVRDVQCLTSVAVSGFHPMRISQRSCSTLSYLPTSVDSFLVMYERFLTRHFYLSQTGSLEQGPSHV